MIARQAEGHHTGEVIAKLAEDAYFMRVNNRVTPAANHEATSRSRTPVDGGRNRISGEYQPTLNHSRASAGGPSHGGHSGGCGGGASSGKSSSFGGKRARGDGDHGGRGHANSHATVYAYGGYDACHWIDEIHHAKKANKVSDSGDFPAYSARLCDLLLPEKFKPLRITKYGAKQDLVH
jgi:hypothetical protein